MLFNLEVDAFPNLKDHQYYQYLKVKQNMRFCEDIMVDEWYFWMDIRFKWTLCLTLPQILRM